MTVAIQLLGLAAVLFLAALTLAVVSAWRARRRGRTAAVDWADLPRRAVGAVWADDRVLRGVASACRRAGVGFPGFVRALVGDDVRLDVAFPTTGSPVPWVATPDGRSWSAPMATLQHVPLDDVAPVEFATVVALGGDASTPGRTVLVDLSRVAGVVALDGDRAARTAVARRIADGLRAAPWTGATAVLAVGRVPGVDSVPTVTLREALAAVDADRTPGVVLVRDRLSGPEGRELARLLERPNGRWGVVVLGPDPLARWTLTCGVDGTLESPELGPVRWMDLALSASAPPAGQSEEGDA